MVKQSWRLVDLPCSRTLSSCLPYYVSLPYLRSSPYPPTPTSNPKLTTRFEQSLQTMATLREDIQGEFSPTSGGPCNLIVLTVLGCRGSGFHVLVSSSSPAVLPSWLDNASENIGLQEHSTWSSSQSLSFHPNLIRWRSGLATMCLKGQCRMHWST